MGVDDAMVAEGNHCLLKGLVSLTEKEKKRKKRQMTDFNWLEHKMDYLDLDRRKKYIYSNENPNYPISK